MTRDEAIRFLDEFQFSKPVTPDNAWDARDELVDALVARGLEVIGTGLYGRILAVPNADWVVKAASDTAWARYVDLIEREPTAHTPVVHFRRTIGERLTLAVIERLNPIYDEDDRGSINKVRQRVRTMETYLERVKWYDAAPIPPGRTPSPLRRTLMRIAQDLPCGVDLHAGNVMWRGDRPGNRTLVITDPVC